VKASAPGKIVLWGEYAVLTGAPAAVLSVNRYAEVELLTRKSGWQFRCQGFKTAAVDTPLAAFCQAPAARIVELILAAHGYRAYPLPFLINSNSEAFYHSARHNKLGIGSSAAICTATYRLLAELLGWQPTLQQAIALHRSLQGGKGSGLDVAASWCGGTIRFCADVSTDIATDLAGDFDRDHRAATASSFQWPADLHWCVVWTGASSNTVSHLQSGIEQQFSGCYHGRRHSP